MRQPCASKRCGVCSRRAGSTKRNGAGRDALGYYHERKDENRDVGLGPEHDWSSHAANSFGLMAIAYEEPSRLANFNRELKYANPASFV